MRSLYRSLKPDLAHHVALPATVVGSLAATGLPVVCLNAMTGLGHDVHQRHRQGARRARGLDGGACAGCSRRPRSAVLVQNVDDRAMIERLGVDRGTDRS